MVDHLSHTDVKLSGQVCLVVVVHLFFEDRHTLVELLHSEHFVLLGTEGNILLVAEISSFSDLGIASFLAMDHI